MSLEELSKQVQEMALALKSAQDENHHYRQELKAAKDEVDRLVRGERERSTETAHSPPAHPSHNQVIYVSQNRRVERFRDRPRNQSEQGILDWIADVKSHLAGRKLSTDEQAAYILDHLAGKARLEIQGRGPQTLTKYSMFLQEYLVMVRALDSSGHVFLNMSKGQAMTY